MDKLKSCSSGSSSNSEHCPKYSFHNLWSTVNSRTPFTTGKNSGKFRKNHEISSDDGEEKRKFFSDLNEKLFRHSNISRMSRSSRRSLCKSTISSHDSGISVVEDYCNSPNSDHKSHSNRNSVHLLSITSVEEQISKTPTASEICCSKQLSKSCNIQQALAENFNYKRLITDHCGTVTKSGEQDYTDTLRRSAQRNREASAKLLPKLNRSRNSLSGYPKPAPENPTAHQSSFADDNLEDSSTTSSILQSSGHEDNISGLIKREISFSDRSDHLQLNFERCSNADSQTSRTTDSFSTSIDSPRNRENMSQLADQSAKNDRQRKRANIAVMLRDMDCDRQGDFGDFLRSEADENLKMTDASEGFSEVSAVEESVQQRLKLENYSPKPSSSADVESTLYATVNKSSIGKSVNDITTLSTSVPNLQTEPADYTSDMKSALPPPLPRKPPPVLPPKAFGRQNGSLTNDRFVLPTSVPNPGHNFCSNCIHVCQNGQRMKNCAAADHNGLGHRCHCYSAVNKRPVVPVHPYFTKSSLDAGAGGRDSPSSSEEFCLRLKLNLDDDDDEDRDENSGVKNQFLISDSKKLAKSTTNAATAMSSVLLSPTVFEFGSKQLSPKPPVPPKPVRGGRSTPTQAAPQPPELPPKRATTQAAINGAEENARICDGVNRGPKLAVDHQSPVSRRNVVSGPKFRDQPKLNAALNDDHSTIRRSRLVAEKSNDSDLYDLLLNQQRRSVDYFGAVLSSSAATSATIIGDHSTDVNFNKNIRLDDIEEAKISTFEDYSNNNNNSKRKNFDSTKISNDDHRRLSIGSDKSVNLDDEKKELIISLTNKLDVLREALADVDDEAAYNEQLGSKIADLVRNSEYLSQNDKDLYRLHVQDVEKITHLLLKLSGQLARIDNDLNGVQASCSLTDKEKLLERKTRLTEQLQDAASLKQDIDERGRRLAKILEKCSNGRANDDGESPNGNETEDDVVDDYLYFMQMKTQLLLDATEIRDKIKLGETQRQALIDSLG